MTLTALLFYASVYGPQAVWWVNINAWWLVPMGWGALELLRSIFG